MLVDIDSRDPDLILQFDLKAEAILGGRLVGKARIRVADLNFSGSIQHASYQLRTKDGKPNGVLNFSYWIEAPDPGAAPAAAVQVPVSAPVANYSPPPSSPAPVVNYSPLPSAPAAGLYPDLSYPPSAPPVPVSASGYYPAADPVALYPRAGHYPPQDSAVSYPPQQSGPGYYPPQDSTISYPPPPPPPVSAAAADYCPPPPPTAGYYPPPGTHITAYPPPQGSQQIPECCDRSLPQPAPGWGYPPPPSAAGYYPPPGCTLLIRRRGCTLLPILLRNGVNRYQSVVIGPFRSRHPGGVILRHSQLLGTIRHRQLLGTIRRRGRILLPILLCKGVNRYQSVVIGPFRSRHPGGVILRHRQLLGTIRRRGCTLLIRRRGCTLLIRRRGCTLLPILLRNRVNRYQSVVIGPFRSRHSGGIILRHRQLLVTIRRRGRILLPIYPPPGTHIAAYPPPQGSQQIPECCDRSLPQPTPGWGYPPGAAPCCNPSPAPGVHGYRQDCWDRGYYGYT